MSAKFEVSTPIGHVVGHDTPSFVVVSDIFVAEPFRRRHYGTALLKHISDTFKKPVYPIGVVPAGEKFWQLWLEKQGAAAVNARELVEAVYGASIEELKIGIA